MLKAERKVERFVSRLDVLWVPFSLSLVMVLLVVGHGLAK